MVPRKLLDRIVEDLTWSPVLAIVGPRQVGKTTLVKRLPDYLDKEVVYLDLELTSDRNKLMDAESYLITLEDKCVVIDEVQLMP